MSRPAPEHFYTGIVARAYAPLRSEEPDPRIYGGFVRRFGQPALELGCGDGDPLLDLVARGLEVEGLDSSADMLARCRVAAEARGLEVVLHQQSMQAMDTGRRYRAIYLAGATFCLLPDDDAARQALARIQAHLEPDGAVLIPLFVPAPVPAHQLGRVREHVEGDGTVLRFSTVAEERDEAAQRVVFTQRYEVVADGTTTVEERDWLLHWYTQAGFTALADGAGLQVQSVVGPDGTPAEPDATTFAFVLQPARP